MEAIKSVEYEVDKVLRLFLTCRDNCNNKIDQLIETVEKAKQEIMKSTERRYPTERLSGIPDTETISLTNEFISHTNNRKSSRP